MSCFKIAAIGLHLLSWHSEPGHNNVNPGIYVRTECDLVVGTYNNSNERQSFYAGFAMRFDFGHFEPFLAAGGVTGYGAAPVIPMMIPGIGIKLGEIAVARFGYIPGKFKDLPHILHGAVEVRF